jgi:hypothetical protein
VTIAAAAICTGKTPTDEPVPTVLCIADRMVTVGNVEFEQAESKIDRLNWGNAVCLIAGDVDLAYQLKMETQRQLQNETASVEEIAQLFACNYALLRRRRAEAMYLTPIGLTVESFVAQQRLLDSEVAARLTTDLQEESLGVSAIIAGVDSTGAHIYRIQDPGGQAECCDRCGFLGIGSGGAQFETQFMLASYDRRWQPLEALLLMFSAKRRAEVSPGVGKATDLVFMNSHGWNRWPSTVLNALDQYYNDLEAAARLKRNEVLKAMSQDGRLIGSTSGPRERWPDIEDDEEEHDSA